MIISNMIYNVTNYYFMFMICVSQRLVVTIIITYNTPSTWKSYMKEV